MAVADAFQVAVVDDEPAITQLVAWMLVRDGRLHVRRYDDPSALLGHTAAGVPLDLLITDVQMPRMDGRVFAAAIRGLLPAVPLLFLSAQIDVLLTEFPGAVLLRKPFRMNHLVDAVGRLLSI